MREVIGSGGPIRLLLLEDDPDDAALVLETLAAEGFAVEAEVAHTRAEFQDRVPSRSYDVILCDFRIPGWDGLEALRWVRRSDRLVPFIYVSGTMGEELAIECIQEGATDYVLKSNLSPRLARAVRRALDEERLRADRDQALQQLGDSEHRFATAFRASPDGITISSLDDGRFIEANDAFLRMLEYERPEVIGRSAGELGIWEPEERSSLLLRLEGPEPAKAIEASFRTKSGKLRQVELSAESIQLQGTPCLLAIIRDVTELRSLERQMRQAQKMEAIGRLAGGVAHDFNNLLGVITGYGEMLSRGLAPDGPHHGKAEQILKAAARAAALTRQLLAFSRQQVLQPKVLDLNHVVSDMDKMLRRLIGEDIELATVLHPDLRNVRADPGQLAQIVMNLAVNARDSMPQGGRLTIETRNVDLDAAYVAMHAPAEPGHYVMLAVSDSGTGMDAETQSHLFEPFFTTKPVGEGTGLGLSTVYGIVKQSDGYIWVYSELGVGTTFKIYLPRVEAPAVAVTEEQRAPPGRSSETVLLVEDEAALREVVQETLEDNGYTVLAARDGAEALRVANACTGPIHVIVTDLVMPVMGGRSAAEEIAPLHPRMKILYISGYSTEAVVHQGLLSRDSAFLGKPFTRADLLRRLRELLDTKSR